MKYTRIIQIFLAICILAICCPNADAQRFGKNKKQYKEFQWKFIESPHFNIYYDDGSKPLADFAAVALENALISIQNTLNYRITARITVVVYDSHNDFEQTNVLSGYLSTGIGGVTELYKNRVVVPFQGSYELFRHVLHHELTHAVINDMFYGGTLQTALTTNGIAEVPLWINEGLAEWESLGGMDPNTDMFMRDLTMNDELPKLKNISGYLAYRAGQTFFYIIEQKYGRGKVTEFMNKLKVLKSIQLTFINTFGMDIDEFSELWQTEVKKIYWPDITIYNQPKEFATQLTNHEKDNCFYYSSPAISPDGERMAFMSDRDGGIFAIYVADTKPTKDKKDKIKKLVSSARQQDFEQLNILTPAISWSPDGKSIAISAKSGGEDAIFILNPINGKYDKIPLHFASITSVSWSPDGNKIAFIGVKRFQSDIYYYDITSKEVVSITNDAFSDANPIWSANSKSIYFISDRGDNLNTNLPADKFKIYKHNYNQSDVYKIDIATNICKRITSSPNTTKTAIAVSDDEQQLLIVANANGISNIYKLNINSQSMMPITNSVNGIMQISTTTNGLNLIFASQVKGGYDIFLMRNPFEKTLGIDTLPMTNYIKGLQKRIAIINDTNASDDSNSDEISNVEISYGKFKTSFSHQQFVNPNEDLINPITQNQNTEQVDGLKENEYETHFSLDAFLINPAVSTYYGVQGNAAALFSDVMGNNQFYISAYIISSLDNSQFLGAYMYNAKTINYSIALYNNSVYTWNYLADSNRSYPYSYRATGAVLGASYPFSLFSRVAFNLNLVNANKHNADIAGYEISKYLLVPELEYVIDNSLNGIYAPTRGSRLFVKARYSPNLGDVSSEFVTLLADARHYFELYPNFMSIAVRGSAGVSTGANPQKFYVGGTDNWINASYRTGDFELDDPADFAFLNSFIMPLRGWPVFVNNGAKFAVANIEYRFPILMAFGAGGLPILIQGIMGNVFYDIGTAFNNDFRISHVNENDTRVVDNLYMSAGWGIRAIVFGLPFKFDMAWRNEYYTWSSPYYLFSLGLDF
jgi:Tol biopolymer transport system component